MLEQNVIDWTQQWKQDGLREGRKEGRRQGRREGEMRFLVRLLERRFGPLEGEVMERLNRADEEQLLRWGERVITASTVDEVFA